MQPSQGLKVESHQAIGVVVPMRKDHTDRAYCRRRFPPDGAHLSEISSQVADDAHAVVILDRAGWHRSQGLVVPGNITLLELPPYSPELNPVKRIWHYLRSHWLANSVFISLADIMDACEMAWNRFATNHGLIRSLCAVAWASASPAL
jgi:DDE superfamily endonuclease